MTLPRTWGGFWEGGGLGSPQNLPLCPDNNHSGRTRPTQLLGALAFTEGCELPAERPDGKLKLISVKFTSSTVAATHRPPPVTCQAPCAHSPPLGPEIYSCKAGMVQLAKINQCSIHHSQNEGRKTRGYLNCYRKSCLTKFNTYHDKNILKTRNKRKSPQHNTSHIWQIPQSPVKDWKLFT